MTFWDQLKYWWEGGGRKDFIVQSSTASALVGIRTSTGIRVTEEQALAFSAVFGAVKILGESIASLPLFLYRRHDRGKEVVRDHPLHQILHDMPNPEQTASEFREMMMAALSLWGNAYAEIVRNALGEVLALWPIHPSRVTVRRQAADQPVEYAVTLPLGAGRVVLNKAQVFHLRAFAINGLEGMSPLRFHRETIALGIAAADFGGRFFGQGMMAGGVLEHPGSLSPTAHDRLKKDIEENRSGLSNAHRVLILEEGMKYNKLTIPPDDAQWLQTRKFQVNEIARIFRIPPHKLMDLERATFSNIEEQNIDFVTDTLMPHLVRWEQTIARDLLHPDERRDLFAKFKPEGLLRGKTLERYQAHAIARQWGWQSVNDILDLEDRNVLGPEGDIYLSPLNMISAEQMLQMVREHPDMEMEQSEGVDDAGRPQRRLAVRRRIGVQATTGNGAQGAAVAIGG